MFQCPTRHVLIPIHKHISVILNSCISRFKGVCHIDVSAITSILVSKLCSSTRILFRSNKHFRIFCTVIQVLLSYINTHAEMTVLLHTFCREHSWQTCNISIKKINAPEMSHLLTPTAQAEALLRARLYRLRCLLMPRRLRLHNGPSSLPTVLVLWCPANQYR